jgi:hypothetical protein
MASVVMTASAMVGTAMNWNRRVNTVAMKLNRALSEPNAERAEERAHNERRDPEEELARAPLLSPRQSRLFLLLYGILFFHEISFFLLHIFHICFEL